MPSRLRLTTAHPHDRVCPCTADLTIDGTGGHWAYVTLEDQLNAACTLSPLPEHAGDGTCSGGDIPKDGRCDPQVCIARFRCTPSTAYKSHSAACAQCDYAVRGTPAATCETGDVSLGLWKGMCGASIALRLSSPSPCWLTSTVALRRVREGRVPHRGRHARPSVLSLSVTLDDHTARCNLCHRVHVRGGLQRTHCVCHRHLPEE